MKRSTYSNGGMTTATAPGLGSKTVEPSDSDDIWPDEYARELHVLSAGDVCFVGADGVTDTWSVEEEWLPFVIPVAVSRVKNAGTTDGIVIKAIR